MAGSSCAGSEEEGHPIPSRRHKSPVVVGGGLSVVVGGSSVVGFEVGGHPIPSRRHWSPDVVVDGG